MNVFYRDPKVKRIDWEGFDRITFDPTIMGGKPCIRGMRVTVDAIVDQVNAGVEIAHLMKNYPYLEHDDITQAIRYAELFGKDQERAWFDQ